MSVDVVIESERVFTGTGTQATPAALALSGDRIAAVGPAEEVHAFARETNLRANTGAFEVRNFGDALVVPGFHDSHVHFFHSALYSSECATTFLGKNEADCVARLKTFAAQRPSGWLLAQGWREYRWDVPILPSKHSLDAAFPHRPVALYSGDAHTLWLNTAAMNELGLHRDSVASPGGSYERDEAGDLTGIVREAAAMELMPRIMGAFSDKEVQCAYRGFLARLAQQGITSVCDLSLMARPGFDFIRDDIHEYLLRAGELTTRVHLFPTLLEDMSRFEQLQGREWGPLLQAPGFKQFFDGVSSQHTAWLTHPYSNARFEGDCGSTTVAPSVMRALVLGAAAKGYPVRIHTIGDAAIHAALDVFEEARNLFGPLPKGRRNCLEHVENFLLEDIERLAQLQVVAAVQPMHMTLDPGGPERDLGPERVALMWPLRKLLEAQSVLAFGSDSPVVDANSMAVLYAAVTRQDATTRKPVGGWLPQERIEMPEALRAYTQGSAAAASHRHELGTLEVGMLADITVLDRNLLTCDTEDILNTNTLATFTGGRCVYER